MNVPVGASAPTGGISGLALAPAQMSHAEADGLAVLVFDSEPWCREELVCALRRHGLPVLAASSAEAALALLRGRSDIGVLLADIRLAQAEGLAFAARAIASRWPARALEVVLVAGHIPPVGGMAALRLGGPDGAAMPVRGASLGQIVAEAARHAADRRRAELAQVAPSHAEAPPAPARTPIGAAEALLYTLARRLADDAALLQRLRASLPALLGGATAQPPGCAEARWLLELVDGLSDLAMLEAGTLRLEITAFSPHALLAALAKHLAAGGIDCGRWILPQADVVPAIFLDGSRTLRALGLLASMVRRDSAAAPSAETRLDVSAGHVRLDLTIRPAKPLIAPPVEEPLPERLLLVEIARRLTLLQGCRLRLRFLPRGGLRAGLLIPRRPPLPHPPEMTGAPHGHRPRQQEVQS